ncbi:MAG: acetate--CoA ligase family protein, partial [Chromatiales bacterium]
MSALRAAARSKLVVVMKSRRVPVSQEPEEAIAAGLTNSDIVCDAALRRAGVLRVERIDEVFAALETLTRMRRLRGERLAIVCNGIGPGMLAVDRLVLSGGQLARLAEATIDALNDVLRTVWPDGNPVDLEADATPELFAKVIHVLRADPEVDAILVLHVPSQAAPSLPAAEATIASANEILKPVITCWMGQESAEPARQLFNQADISTFNTPEQAVDAFMHMVRYRRNQAELAQVPPLPGPNERVCQTAAVWAMVGEAVNAGRTLLSDPECDRVLAAAGIPAAKSYYVADAGELREVAAGLVPPFALKILSDAVCRPFAGFRATCEHGRGVALDLGSVGELEAAAVDLTAAEQRRD